MTINNIYLSKLCLFKFILGVKMKKLILCGAVLAAMAMTACSSTKNGNGSGLSSSTKPVVAKPVVVPVVEKVNVIESKQAAHHLAFGAGLTGPDISHTIDENSYAVTVNGKAHKQADFAEFGQGRTTADWKETVTGSNDNKKTNVGFKGKLHLFQQGYSVAGAKEITHKIADGKETAFVPMDMDFIKGNTTKTLPKGSATYAGDVTISGPQNGQHKGQFTYNVDFDAAKGSGQVTGVNGHNITLKETKLANIDHYNAFDGSTSKFQGFKGDATRDGKSGSYALGIFGPNADEVTGRVTIGGKSDGYNGSIGGKVTSRIDPTSPVRNDAGATMR